MSSIKEPKIVKVLPLLVKVTEIEGKLYTYPAFACANPEHWRGELNLTYSQFHGWNWANAKEQLKRSIIMPISSLPMYQLADELFNIKGWTLEPITKEAYEHLLKQANEQMETRTDV